MKRQKNENGFLAIEASLVVFFLIFFMLFIWNFASLFSAQNMVSHAAMQTGQAIAVDNMSRKTIKHINEGEGNVLGKVDSLAKKLFGIQISLSDIAKTFDELGESEQKKKIEDTFNYFFSGDSSDAKQEAASMRVDPNSIEFSNFVIESKTGLVKFTVKYKVKFMFSVFGIDGMDMEKNVMFRLYGHDGG